MIYNHCVGSTLLVLTEVRNGVHTLTRVNSRDLLSRTETLRPTLSSGRLISVSNVNDISST